MKNKKELLKVVVEHYDIKKTDVIPMVDAMSKMAFQARNLGRAAQIYDRMLAEKDCGIILCLAGSLFSAGLKKVVYDMVSSNMVDAIVSTGANIVDQDFFEGLGYKHYVGTPFVDDNMLRENHVDRIYDTYIDEDELRDCDMTIANIANELEPRPYSSREFIHAMGAHLEKHGKNKESVVLACYKHDVPIFVPALSDCSAGFGLVHHQWNHPKSHVTLDSAKDFLELTKLKLMTKETGLLMIGGGVTKNFAQATVEALTLLTPESRIAEYPGPILKA